MIALVGVRKRIWQQDQFLTDITRPLVNSGSPKMAVKLFFMLQNLCLRNLWKCVISRKFEALDSTGKLQSSWKYLNGLQVYAAGLEIFTS